LVAISESPWHPSLTLPSQLLRPAQAITALLTPTTATLGGFTNARAAGEEGATASTLTRLVAAAAGQTDNAAIGSDATSTLPGSVLSDAAGLVQAAPAGALVGAGRVHG